MNGKETVSLQKLESGSYQITRMITEEVTAEELVKISGDIQKAIDETQHQVDEMPKQVAVRNEQLNNSLTMLKDRMAVFQPAIDALPKPEAPAPAAPAQEAA